MSAPELPGSPLDVLVRALAERDWRACEGAAKALEERPDEGAAEPLLRLVHTAAGRDPDGDDNGGLVGAGIQAALALGKMRHLPAVEPFLRIVEEALFDPASENLTLSWYVIDALGLIADPRAVDLLVRALDYWEIDVRKAARTALGRIGEPAVLPLLGVLRDSPSIYAIQALGRIGDPRAIEPLVELLRRDDVSEYVRGQAALALGQLRATRTLDLLLGHFTDPGETSYVRGHSARGLGLLGDRRAFEPLVAALTSPDWGIRAEAATGLGHLRDPRATAPLARLLVDTQDEVCRAAARALAEIGDDRALPALLSAHAAARHSSRSDYVQRTIAAAIGTIRRH
jgi:HEAT repeat protein